MGTSSKFYLIYAATALMALRGLPVHADEVSDWLAEQVKQHKMSPAQAKSAALPRHRKMVLGAIAKEKKKGATHGN